MDATEDGHLTELLYDDGHNDDTLVCAAHGGDVEPGTTALAVEVTMTLPDATCWSCLGHDDVVGAYDAWHPPSKAIDPGDHELLARIADRGFDTVLSIHALPRGKVPENSAQTRVPSQTGMLPPASRRPPETPTEETPVFTPGRIS